MLHLGTNGTRTKDSVLKKVKVDGQWKLCPVIAEAAASSKIECRPTAALKCITKTSTTSNGASTANAYGNPCATDTTSSNEPGSKLWNWMPGKPGCRRRRNLLHPRASRQCSLHRLSPGPRRLRLGGKQEGWLAAVHRYCFPSRPLPDRIRDGEWCLSCDSPVCSCACTSRRLSCGRRLSATGNLTSGWRGAASRRISAPAAERPRGAPHATAL
jgi:hypothetical protein